MGETKKLYKQQLSKIHGNGLYAAEDIPAGTRVIEYVGEKITKAESERRAKEWDKHARTKGFGLVYIFELNKRYDLDGNVRNNPAKYINHNCDANCEARNIRGHIWIVALEDIKQGDELSFDYGYDIDNFLDHHCKCGAETCVGYIVHEDQRKRVKQILESHYDLVLDKIKEQTVKHTK